MVRDETHDMSVEDLEPDEAGDGGAVGFYSLDSILVRQEQRTVYEVMRRLDKGSYIISPELPRQLVWDPWQQSRLVESVLMRIPLPLFYLAEEITGRLLVIDGAQRLLSLRRFLRGDFALAGVHSDLEGKKFDDLPAKLQNRIEDTALSLCIIEARVPEQARLEIFLRINSGEPLTRQQMRNAIHVGPATDWIKVECSSALFLEVTGGSLDPQKMRDREAVNRFCSFHLLGPERYLGDMDGFLAQGLHRMNGMEPAELDALRSSFRRSLENNRAAFGPHAFRRPSREETRRGPLNLALFDALSVVMTRFNPQAVAAVKQRIQAGLLKLLEQEDFIGAISRTTTAKSHVELRFKRVSDMLEEALRADAP